MIVIHKSSARGITENSWLNSRHSFSFGEYYDPQHMHFSFLRVINEDIISPSSGFPMHSHKDMEIITYLISGELAHKDSLGNVDSIKSGEIQLMRAGSGITHSEYNLDKATPTHLLQIWIMPRENALPPSYQQKNFTDLIKPNKLCKIISKNLEQNTLHIQQDVEIYVAKLNNYSIEYTTTSQHKLWIQVVSGNLTIGEYNLEHGDGAGITNETILKISSNTNAEFLVFDFS